MSAEISKMQRLFAARSVIGYAVKTRRRQHLSSLSSSLLFDETQLQVLSLSLKKICSIAFGGIKIVVLKSLRGIRTPGYDLSNCDYLTVIVLSPCLYCDYLFVSN